MSYLLRKSFIEIFENFLKLSSPTEVVNFLKSEYKNHINDNPDFIDRLEQFIKSLITQVETEKQQLIWSEKIKFDNPESITNGFKWEDYLKQLNSQSTRYFFTKGSITHIKERDSFDRVIDINDLKNIMDYFELFKLEIKQETLNKFVEDFKEKVDKDLKEMEGKVIKEPIEIEPEIKVANKTNAYPDLKQWEKEKDENNLPDGILKPIGMNKLLEIEESLVEKGNFIDITGRWLGSVQDLADLLWAFKVKKYFKSNTDNKFTSEEKKFFKKRYNCNKQIEQYLYPSKKVQFNKNQFNHYFT